VKYGLIALLAGGTLLAQIPWEKNRPQAGQALYRENCVVCHEVDRAESKKLGPSFYQLFKREKMPLSNMKPNRQYLTVRVKFGGKLMPAFQKKLTDAQINSLIDYLESR
jgi:mono/diheme cytochrome c family protein